MQASISGSSASSTSSTPEVLPQPLKTLHLTKTPSNQVTIHNHFVLSFRNTERFVLHNKSRLCAVFLIHELPTFLSQSPVISRGHSAAQEKKFDLLSDLGGDIFAPPQSQTAGSSNFANFAHFNRPSGNHLFFQLCIREKHV